MCPVTLSVVLPIYQEGPHLREVLSAIEAQLLLTDASYEIILIDDGSASDTWTIIKEQCKVRSCCRAVRLSRNFGKEAAVCAGLERARGEAMIVIDADLQHPPHLIPDMVDTWRKSDLNIVEAVKTSYGNTSLVSTLCSKLFYLAINKLSGFVLTNATDFKLIDRNVRDAWLRMGETNLFFRGMIAWLGFKSTQIPFVVPERIGGTSRWTTLRLIGLALTGLTSFSSQPLRFVSLLGVLFFIFGVFLGGWVLFYKMTGQAVSGFTTVIVLQLLIGSLLMFSLGIIGEYIGKIYEEVKGRPRYVVAETEDPFENVSPN